MTIRKIPRVGWSDVWTQISLTNPIIGMLIDKSGDNNLHEKENKKLMVACCEWGLCIKRCLGRPREEWCLRHGRFGRTACPFCRRKGENL